MIGFDSESETISEDGETATTVSLQLLTNTDTLPVEYRLGRLQITVGVIASQATFGKFFHVGSYSIAYFNTRLGFHCFYVLCDMHLLLR